MGLDKCDIKKGDKFGRLTIESEIIGHRRKDGKKQRRFKLICDCGKKVEAPLHTLRSGRTKSCGCSKKESFNPENLDRTTHGLSKTRIYKVWCAILNRCDNNKYAQYKDYGGRGITYDEKWKDFMNFYHDMIDEYREGLTIDRIDNNGNYTKSNCRWTTMRENTRNRRSNNVFSWKGKDRCLIEISEMEGIDYGLLSNRVNALNWGIDKAVYTPKRKNKASKN